MEIRKLTKKKLAEFHRVYARILKECFPEYPTEAIDFFIGRDFEKNFVEKKVEDWTHSVLLAFEKGEIVGFLVMEKTYEGVSFANWLGILKEHQGKGIGRALLQAWEEEVLKDGGHKLMLINHEEENRGFYKKNGFKEEGFEEKLWFGLDYWVYGRVIAEPNLKLIVEKLVADGVSRKLKKAKNDFSG